MRQYTIARAAGPVPLTGDVADTPWADADVLQIDCYPWYESGARQQTAARLLYDDEAVCVQFQCQDRHIFAQVTELNGPVCTDSCVELFATIDPAAGPDYFNIEINCCGTFLVGYGPARRPRSAITPEWARRVSVVTSIDAATKVESPDDDGWWAAAAVPFAVISHLAAKPVQPAAGAVWAANLYRCGGVTDPQLATWNPVDTERWPNPDFHRPDQFGRLTFG